MTATRHAVLAALLSLAAPAGALEISLTENKGESGSIGFVDIRRVFREFTDARRTKDAFERRVREKESEFKDQEDAISRLKEQILKLEQEKSFLQKLPILEAPKPQAPAPVKTSTAIPEGIDPELAALPGMGDLAASTAAVAAADAETQAEPEESEPALDPTGPGITRQALEKQTADIDNKLVPLREKLKQAEAALAETKNKVEKDLLGDEKRETKRLLARIYRTVQDVALAEGISVVIDKESILYGQKAVDLTDKVLERL